MAFLVFGAGLVGSYLGAAGGAAWARRRHGPVRAAVRLPAGLRTWAPAAAAPAHAPVLIATRIHQTPWDGLPADALAAQNGIGQPGAVAVCFLALDRAADGTIASVVPPRIVVGPLAPAWSPVLAAWRDAGLAVEQVADPAPAQWEKTILNASVGPLCLGTGLGMGAVWADPGLRALVLAATAEGARIAAAAGVAIAPGLEARAAAFFDRAGAHRPSVLADPGELPWILGALLARAAALGVAAPALAAIEARCAVAGGR
jgi:2-dehydropantoate 2-reductase